MATKPLSGALDMVSKSVEGGLATIDGVKSITEVQKNRLRYPRAFLGDRVLRPYNAYTAQGQHIFRTSLVQGKLEDLEITKELNPFGDEIYEHHEPLPSDRVFVVTDQRVLSIKVARGRLEGGKIVWHAHFLDILSTELADGGDNPRVLRVILSANMGKKFSFQEQKLHRDVHCFPKQNQAMRLLQFIDKKRQEYTERLNKPDILLTFSDTVDHAGGEGEGGLGAGEDCDTTVVDMSRECVDFEMVWHSKDYRASSDQVFEVISIWRPKSPSGYFSLGDVVSFGLDPPSAKAIVAKEGTYQGSPWLAKPLSFRLEWRDTKQGKSSPSAFWIPVAPEGYVPLGCVVQTGNREPSKDAIRCVRKDLVFESSTFDSPCWTSYSNDKQRWQITLWQVDNSLNTFLPCRSNRKPDQGLVGFDLMM